MSVGDGVGELILRDGVAGAGGVDGCGVGVPGGQRGAAVEGVGLGERGRACGAAGAVRIAVGAVVGVGGEVVADGGAGDGQDAVDVGGGVVQDVGEGEYERGVPVGGFADHGADHGVGVAVVMACRRTARSPAVGLVGSGVQGADGEPAVWSGEAEDGEGFGGAEGGIAR